MHQTREELLALLHEGSAVMFQCTEALEGFVGRVESKEHALLMAADAWVDKVEHAE